MDPLRKEIARVVRENNHLHMEVGRAREELRDMEQTAKSAEHRANADMAELRFVNSHLTNKLRMAVAEGDKVKQRLDDALRKGQMFASC